jgi:hypothetical protein
VVLGLGCVVGVAAIALVVRDWDGQSRHVLPWLLLALMGLLMAVSQLWADN